MLDHLKDFLEFLKEYLEFQWELAVDIAKENLVQMILFVVAIVGVYNFLLQYILSTISKELQPFLPIIMPLISIILKLNILFIATHDYLKSIWTIGAFQSAIYVYILIVLFYIVIYFMSKNNEYEIKNIFSLLICLSILAWYILFFFEVSFLYLFLFSVIILEIILILSGYLDL